MTYGATPDDWAALQRLGLEDDLLPVVSNPGAKISERSKMRDLGKTPSRYDQQGKVVGIPKWTAHIATDREVARWATVSDLGICIQTRQVRAIDIDIADPVEAARVRELVELMTSLPQRRRASSGKCLLAFRMPGEFAKRVIRTPHGIIEFLANGQQFIAVGTHPSGDRYEWVDGDGVLGLPAFVPALSPAEFEVLWQAMVEAFALPDGESRARNGMVPVKPRNANDLQDPTVAWLDENGWVTGFERDGRVDVRCPWEDGHSTDSGPTSTSYFPAGVGGFAQGHFRCLHASCQGRTDGDFLEAVGYGASDFDVVEAVANATGDVSKALPAFTRARSGQIEATILNVLLALRRSDVCGMRIAFDTFKDALLCAPADADTWRPFTDSDYVTLRATLETGATGFKPVGRELIRDAVRKVATEQTFDSAVQWAESLRWDGVPRVEGFWARYFGVEDTPYSRAVSLYTWTAFAGRALVPGEKCDMVPVLIGLQGAGKTSMIEALAPTPDAFAGINLEKKDDDIARGIRGKLVCELAELRGLASREAEAIKDWISRRFEEWVPKYQEFGTRFGRRFLAIGTGNREGFLDDETGERRWLPMRVGDIDTAAVRADRDQLWAEGVELFKRSGVAWQGAFELGRHEHQKFKVGDVWCEHIEEWLATTDMDGPRDRSRVRLRDVLVGAIGLQVRQITRREELRAGKALTLLGFEKKVARLNGVMAKVWVRDTQAAPDYSDLA
jgi:predicted P-loop ATPase